MMVTFLLAVLYAAIAVCVVVYFLVFFNRPTALHRMLARRSNRYDGKLSLSVRLLIYAWLAAVFLGLAFCVHRGAVKLLFWVADRDAAGASRLWPLWFVPVSFWWARKEWPASLRKRKKPTCKTEILADSLTGILATALRGLANDGHDTRADRDGTASRSARSVAPTSAPSILIISRIFGMVR